MRSNNYYINGTALEEELERVFRDHYKQANDKTLHDFFNAVRRRIRRHKVDAKEVVYSEWVFNMHQAPGEKSYFCRACTEGESDYGRDNFCPNCGASMCKHGRV